MAMTTPDSGYAFGGDRFLYGVRLTTVDGGNSWRADSMHSKAIKSVFFLDRKHGIVTGQDGFFFTTSNGGTTWQFHQPQLWNYLQAVTFSDPFHGIAVGGEGYQVGKITTYSDFAVQISLDSLKHELCDVAFSSQLNATAVGYGIVQRTNDAGRTWQELNIKGDNYRAVCFPTQQIGYIIGLAGSILKTTDEGKKWSFLQAPTTLSLNGELRDVAFADENTGFICGDNGLLLTTDNGGRTWRIVSDLPKVKLNAIVLKGKTGWILGNKGTLIRFSF